MISVCVCVSALCYILICDSQSCQPIIESGFNVRLVMDPSMRQLDLVPALCWSICTSYSHRLTIASFESHSWYTRDFCWFLSRILLVSYSDVAMPLHDNYIHHRDINKCLQQFFEMDMFHIGVLFVGVQ